MLQWEVAGKKASVNITISFNCLSSVVGVILARHSTSTPPPGEIERTITAAVIR